MRRVVIIALVLGLAVMAAFRHQGNVPMYSPWATVVQVLSPTPTPLAHDAYMYAYWEVDDPNRLELVANYATRLKAAELSSVHGCSKGINGGFYDEQNRPLGLVVSKSAVVRGFRENQLFNGLVATQADGIYVGDFRDGTYISAVQTGPVLIRKGQIVDLQLSRDKAARRMVATQDNQGRARFIAIYADKDSVVGPTLDELPGVVAQIAQTNNWSGITAVNLDGGSAAAFMNESVTLPDWQPVGSWWCYKSVIQ